MVTTSHVFHGGPGILGGTSVFVGTRVPIFTVHEMRWLGKQNGELLQLMAGQKFEVLQTGDQNIRHQQNL